MSRLQVAKIERASSEELIQRYISEGIDPSTPHTAVCSSPTQSYSTTSTTQVDTIPELLRYVTEMFVYHVHYADQSRANLSTIVGKLLNQKRWARWCCFREDGNSNRTVLAYAVENRLQTWTRYILVHDWDDSESRAQLEHSLFTTAVSATLKKDILMLGLLLEHGSRKGIRTRLFLQVLENAITSCDSTICDFILRYIPQNDTVLGGDETKGWTPLHQAALCSSAPIIRQLLRKYAQEVNPRTVHLNTPLLVACRREVIDLAVCRELVEAGADVTARNRLGHSPIDLANFRGQREVLVLLISSRSDSMRERMRATRHGRNQYGPILRLGHTGNINLDHLGQDPQKRSMLFL